MTEHFNIQIGIQRVEEPRPLEATQRTPLGGAVQMTERRVIKMVDLALTAETEREAYAKAHKLLSASEPEWTQGEPHLHRASCDDAGGNLMCGYPPGPTIADSPAVRERGSSIR